MDKIIKIMLYLRINFILVQNESSFLSKLIGNDFDQGNVWAGVNIDTFDFQLIQGWEKLQQILKTCKVHVTVFLELDHHHVLPSCNPAKNVLKVIPFI
jgi:hypothetical protein